MQAGSHRFYKWECDLSSYSGYSDIGNGISFELIISAKSVKTSYILDSFQR